MLTTGETLVTKVVAPFDQEILPVHPETVKIAESPKHIEVLLLTNEIIGEGVTVIITAEELSLTQLFKVQATL